MENETKPAEQSAPAPAPLIINWALTEDAAQKVIECFEALTKIGGLQNAEICLPLAKDLMKASQAAREKKAEAPAGN